MLKETAGSSDVPQLLGCADFSTSSDGEPYFRPNVMRISLFCILTTLACISSANVEDPLWSVFKGKLEAQLQLKSASSSFLLLKSAHPSNWGTSDDPAVSFNIAALAGLLPSDTGSFDLSTDFLSAYVEFLYSVAAYIAGGIPGTDSAVSAASSAEQKWTQTARRAICAYEQYTQQTSQPDSFREWCSSFPGFSSALNRVLEAESRLSAQIDLSGADPRVIQQWRNALQRVSVRGGARDMTQRSTYNIPATITSGCSDSELNSGVRRLSNSDAGAGFSVLMPYYALQDGEEIAQWAAGSGGRTVFAMSMADRGVAQSAGAGFAEVPFLPGSVETSSIQFSFDNLGSFDVPMPTWVDTDLLQSFLQTAGAQCALATLNRRVSSIVLANKLSITLVVNARGLSTFQQQWNNAYSSSFRIGPFVFGEEGFSRADTSMKIDTRDGSQRIVLSYQPSRPFVLALRSQQLVQVSTQQAMSDQFTQGFRQQADAFTQRATQGADAITNQMRDVGMGVANNNIMSGLTNSMGGISQGMQQAQNFASGPQDSGNLFGFGGQQVTAQQFPGSAQQQQQQRPSGDSWRMQVNSDSRESLQTSSGSSYQQLLSLGEVGDKIKNVFGMGQAAQQQPWPTMENCTDPKCQAGSTIARTQMRSTDSTRRWVLIAVVGAILVIVVIVLIRDEISALLNKEDETADAIESAVERLRGTLSRYVGEDDEAVITTPRMTFPVPQPAPSTSWPPRLPISEPLPRPDPTQPLSPLSPQPVIQPLPLAPIDNTLPLVRPQPPLDGTLPPVRPLPRVPSRPLNPADDIQPVVPVSPDEFQPVGPALDAPPQPMLPGPATVDRPGSPSQQELADPDARRHNQIMQQVQRMRLLQQNKVAVASELWQIAVAQQDLARQKKALTDKVLADTAKVNRTFEDLNQVRLQLKSKAKLQSLLMGLDQAKAAFDDAAQMLDVLYSQKDAFEVILDGVMANSLRAVLDKLGTATMDGNRTDIKLLERERDAAENAIQQELYKLAESEKFGSEWYQQLSAARVRYNDLVKAWMPDLTQYTAEDPKKCCVVM
eukprot:TRINITY_DN11798_c0_g2_i1.p1 TRINITY_DN11798_c0_g2~~TRINITY_DN11798_c0_g2_i1.p1  ORF type:complete len:1058 (-),score=257.66 TRINITY_DN11798_c0_g2_i1:18-3191(-)